MSLPWFDSLPCKFLLVPLALLRLSSYGGKLMGTLSVQEAVGGSIYSDFVEYQDLDAKDARDPVHGMIYAIDTNVLLSLYRYPLQTVESVTDALRKMSNVLFVPHQTMREFWALLEDVRKGSHHSEASGKISHAAETIEKEVGKWLGRTYINKSADNEAVDEIRKVLEELSDVAGRLQESISKTKEESQSGGSGIVEVLEKILDGRVGPAPTRETRKRLLDDFRKRVDAGIPPGNRDAEAKGNTDKGSGDFFIWQQCLDEARRRKMTEGKVYDLTLITNDLKDDWVREKEPRPLALRALVHEYAAEVGGVFRIATTFDLLDTASSHFGATVSEETRAQVKELGEAAAVRWTAEGARAYLAALWNNEYYRDHLVVLLASYGVARNEALPLTVEEAKQISTRENMHGFAKPYKTVLAMENIVGVGGTEITLPMLSRRFHAASNDWAYILQGDCLSALEEVIARDSDYTQILDDVTRQIEDIRQTANA